MEKYTKYFLLGMILPSFIVFFSVIPNHAFLTAYGFFYTFSVEGLNLTTYSILGQVVVFTLWDPLAIVDPKSAFYPHKTVLALKISNSLYANTWNTEILLRSFGGKFFILSLIVAIAGYTANYYVSQRTNRQFVTENMDENVNNPYSKIILFLTLLIVLIFQFTSQHLVIMENGYFSSTSFVVPVGTFFILFALISIIFSLEEHYLFVIKNIIRVVVTTAFILTVLVIIINFNNIYDVIINFNAVISAVGFINAIRVIFFSTKIVFFVFLTFLLLILYYNIVEIRQLKEQNRNISRSLLRQFVSPITILYGKYFSSINPEFDQSNIQENKRFQNVPPLFMFIIKAILFLILLLIVYLMILSWSFTISLYTNFVLIFLILIVFSMVNINKYNYEGRMKIMLNFTLIVSLFFITELVDLLFLHVINVVPLSFP